MYIVSHTSRANRVTFVSFTSDQAAQAQFLVRCAKRSPKTKSVSIYESAIAPQWPRKSKFSLALTSAIADLSPMSQAIETATIHKHNCWFRVWHQLTSTCRIIISPLKRD